MQASLAVAGILFLLSSVVFADSTNQPFELVERLFKDYNAQASPYVGRQKNFENSTQSVSFRLFRAILASVNERDWTNSILVSVNYKWVDPRLTWDPSTSDGISAISMKTDAVWQPNLYPCESIKISPVFKDLKDTESVSISYDGTVYLHVYQVVNFICKMDFDDFPFDKQDCSLCFALDGVDGAPLILDDISEYPIELRVLIRVPIEAFDLHDYSLTGMDIQSNSEWDVVQELTKDEYRVTQDGVQSHLLLFRFSLARRGFFWIFLIVIPTCLFCLVTLIGVFFYEGDDAVQNAASIGLTTMTSLMLVVTIVEDALDKSDNLPGLGWFVFAEISVVCISVIALLILDGLRAMARGYERRNMTGCCDSAVRMLTSKKVFRATRFTLFLMAITALILNPILNWN